MHASLQSDPYHNPVAKVVAHRAREEKQHGVEKAAAMHNAGLLTQEDATVNENAGKPANWRSLQKQEGRIGEA